MKPGFDWPALMRAGLHSLGLSPADFWNLTPAEFLMMLGLENDGSGVLNRARLAELSARFPDAPRQ